MAKENEIVLFETEDEKVRLTETSQFYNCEVSVNKKKLYDILFGTDYGYWSFNHQLCRGVP